MITTKKDDEVFGRWICWQRIYQCRDITTFIDHANQAYWENFAAECNKNDVLRKDIDNLFEIDPQAKMIINGQQTLTTLLNFINTDIDSFLNYLKTHHLFDDAPPQPLSEDDIFKILDQNITLTKTLFFKRDMVSQGEFLFSVANRFFEYCFIKDSRNRFFAMLHHEPDYPLARFVQSILWHYLSAEGWRDWHVNSLLFLKNESESGKTIVYVAGGIDIYQLLTHGIYNIEVIDPFLPSQGEGFYAQGWGWLVELGDIGDEIVFTRNIILRRHSYELLGTFKAVVESGETIDINHTKTTWLVCNKESLDVLGHVVFNRRFVTQSDFEVDPVKTVLVSFNEMYMLSAPSYCGGWGIDAECFPDDMIMAVKQLDQPIQATTFKNLTNANDVPFRFVNLGGNVT